MDDDCNPRIEVFTTRVRVEPDGKPQTAENR